MLNSLRIKNYRNLEDLEIKSLGRVNLITGKNNTGKSSVLETISILVNHANPSILISVLKNRGETFSKFPDVDDYSDINVQIFKKFFFNINYEKKISISASDSENSIRSA